MISSHKRAQTVAKEKWIADREIKTVSLIKTEKGMLRFIRMIFQSTQECSLIAVSNTMSSGGVLRTFQIYASTNQWLHIYIQGQNLVSLKCELYDQILCRDSLSF